MNENMRLILIGVGAFFLLGASRNRQNGSSSDGSTRQPDVSSIPGINSRVEKFNTQIKTASTRWNVPVDILASVIMQESSGIVDAEGAAGEYGLMQLMEVAVQDVQEIKGLPWMHPSGMDASENIFYGAAFLRIQKDRWSSRGDDRWYQALRAYNCGFQGSVRQPGCGSGYATEVLRRVNRRKQNPPS
jgi:soluble lytic murein transglycosylase-like protein